MPAYNFQKQFAPAVESGQKRTTIRRPRKRRTVVGDTLSLYTGMRQKNCRKLLTAECLAVPKLRRMGTLTWKWTVRIPYGEQQLAITTESLLCLAWLDGFETVEEFDRWFERYDVPTDLVLIRW